jgi:hypothetical protein
MGHSTTLSKKPKSKLLLLVYAFIRVSGCQSLLINPIGHMVAEDKRITIPDSGEQTGVYKTGDLVIISKLIKTAPDKGCQLC